MSTNKIIEEVIKEFRARKKKRNMKRQDVFEILRWIYWINAEILRKKQDEEIFGREWIRIRKQIKELAENKEIQQNQEKRTSNEKRKRRRRRRKRE